MSERPRIISHIHGELLAPVREAHPDLEIVELEIKDAVPEDLRGDILLTYTWGTPNLDEVLSRGIQWVHVYGTGVNHFPFDRLKGRTMTCSRGASATAISEWVIAVLLAAEKQLPQSWLAAPPEPPARWNVGELGTLAGRNLALIGFGAIAQAIARRALPFEMHIEALRRKEQPSEVEGVRVVTSLESLLADADHVVVAAPETSATHHLLNDEAFGFCRAGVHLVNVARGGLVDQDALRRALDGGTVGLATLDCVDPEPLPEGHWLYEHPSVRLTPHISWAAPASYAGLIERFVENLGAWRRGEALKGVVDPVEGY